MENIDAPDCLNIDEQGSTCPFYAHATDYKIPGCMLYSCRYKKEEEE